MPLPELITGGNICAFWVHPFKCGDLDKVFLLYVMRIMVIEVVTGSVNNCWYHMIR